MESSGSPVDWPWQRLFRCMISSCRPVSMARCSCLRKAMPLSTLATCCSSLPASMAEPLRTACTQGLGAGCLCTVTAVTQFELWHTNRIELFHIIQLMQSMPLLQGLFSATCKRLIGGILQWAYLLKPSSLIKSHRFDFLPMKGIRSQRSVCTCDCESITLAVAYLDTWRGILLKALLVDPRIAPRPPSLVLRRRRRTNDPVQNGQAANWRSSFL